VVQDGASSIPVGMTILPGNVNDQEHFKCTYDQVRDDLDEGSRIIFDAGAHGKPNVDLLLADRMRYLCRMKLNASDDRCILGFKEGEWELVDVEDGIYGKKLVFPSRVKYLYFSRKLREDLISRKRCGLERKYEEAMMLKRTIVDGRRTPKRCKSSNPFLDVRLLYQFKLHEMSKEEAMERALELSLTGREGFFALVSNEDFSLDETLRIYREKDSVERLFNSLKNEIRIRPARC
jgi:transposase